MAISVSFNGVVYSIPETGEESWGEALTSYFSAIPTGCLQKVGGAFTLTSNANFGANYGLLSAYFSTRTASPSTAGLLRLAITDTIGWRNNANSGNLLLSVDASDRLVFNGTSFISNAITALTGDVTATGPGSVPATVAFVGAYSAANVAAGATLANAATNSNTNLAIVKRDGSGNFSAGTISAALAGNASTVTTNANLTGDVTSVGNATTLTNAPVIAKVLTGYTSGAGTVAASDSILQAIQKLNGNDSTNANLTGPITSVGNATSVAAQTGTGSTFVMQASPTLTTPVIGAATGTSLSVSGQLTSTVATGTAPLVVSSTTQVANLNAATAGNATTVTTNANLTGDVTSVGNATTLTNAPVIAKVLTGYTSGAGTVGSSDSILQAIQKLNGNDATNANLTGPITSVGNATSVASQTGTGSTFAMAAGPTFTGTAAHANITASGTSALTGNVGIGGVSDPSVLLYMTGTSSGSVNQYAAYGQVTFNSSATSLGAGFLCAYKTTAASFTLANAYGFKCNDIVKGAGSTVTTQYGFYCDSLSNGGTNYAYYSAGTNPSSFGGNVAVVGNLNVAATTTSVGGVWTAYTPTVGSGSGAITTSSATGRYQEIGKIVHVYIAVSITVNGTGGTYITATLPLSTNVSNNYILSGIDGTSHKALSILGLGSNVIRIYLYDGTYPGVSSLAITGIYESV